MANAMGLAPALLAGFALAVSGAAQGNKEELQAKLEKKLAGEWLKNAEWITDYEAAKVQAKESGKLIFAYFTRSYSP